MVITTISEPDSQTYNFSNLSKSETVTKYLEKLNALKRLINEQNDISETEFNRSLIVYFNQSAEKRKNVFVKSMLDSKKRVCLAILIIFVAYALVSYKHEASSLVLRNIQTYIYPGMKLWRKMSVPIISIFPSLTEYYDESCLLTNPFFQVGDLNCLPCAEVANVLDFSDVHPATTPYDSPFIYKMTNLSVNLHELRDLYADNADIFKQDAFKVHSTNREIKNIDDLIKDFFNKTNQIESHNLWRCNRMTPARLLRQLFPRPSRLQANGIALERFLAVDTPAASPYRIPDTECSNMFIMQAYGTRTIVLRPTAECRHKCRTLSVRLPTSYILNYNWWYWKPISMQDQLTKTSSITYIGSYC